MLTYRNGLVVIHRKNKNMKTTISSQDIKKDNSYNEKLILLPQNDTGNARRFLLFCRKYVVYNTSLQCWMLWNGKIWDSEGAYDEIMVLAQAVMEKILLSYKRNKDYRGKRKKGNA